MRTAYVVGIQMQEYTKWSGHWHWHSRRKMCPGNMYKVAGLNNELSMT